MLPEKTPLRLYIVSLISLPIASIVLGCINPWLFFTAIPALLVPSIFTAWQVKNIEKTVLSINGKISFKDMIEMMDSGEWKELGKELNNTNTKTKSASNLKTPEAIKAPKSSSFCKAEQDDKTNNLDI